jgi:hypothetical protein
LGEDDPRTRLAEVEKSKRAGYDGVAQALVLSNMPAAMNFDAASAVGRCRAAVQNLSG